MEKDRDAKMKYKKKKSRLSKETRVNRTWQLRFLRHRNGSRFI